MRVTVVGAGSWGTTIASLTAKRHETVVWAREPGLAADITERHVNPLFLPGLPLSPRLTATDDLTTAAARAEVLIAAVPTHVFRPVLERLRGVLPGGVPVISLAKGLEPGSLLRMSEVVAETLPENPPAVLTGPNLAKEILAGQAAASVLATRDPALAAELQAVLRRGLLRVYTNTDVIGCELGGALKNVIAIASGMAQGLGVGDNTRAAVMTRGLSELARLGVVLGGDPATFAGLTGMGDLVATCMSPQSRNRHVGEQVGRGRPVAEVLAEMTQVAEGVKTAAAAVELADRYGLGLPICRTVHKVVGGELTAAQAYAGLRHNPAGHESGPW